MMARQLANAPPFACIHCVIADVSGTLQQVVGAFLEGGTPEETAAIKKVADKRPPAPADIDALGLEFAAKL